MVRRRGGAFNAMRYVAWPHGTLHRTARRMAMSGACAFGCGIEHTARAPAHRLHNAGQPGVGRLCRTVRNDNNDGDYIRMNPVRYENGKMIGSCAYSSLMSLIGSVNVCAYIQNAVCHRCFMLTSF